MRDILYVTKGRREFTEHTFNLLLENTNWDLVNRLIVYDDGSLDGSKLWIRKNIGRCPQEHYLRTTHLGSPVSVMNDYVNQTDAKWFCKIDNDICLPPGWLDAMVSVTDAHPELQILGMEVGMSGRPADDWDGVYGVNEDCTHIGGIGLINVAAYKRYPRPLANGRFGWTESQHKFVRKSAWISPDILCPLLDHLEFEPWMGLSHQYVARGLQRDMGKYPKEMAWSWSWMWPS